jgi:hypothetical protein
MSRLHRGVAMSRLHKGVAMSRLSVPRLSTAVSVVAVVVAIYAVMFPGLGFGQTNSGHGVSLSDVYTQTFDDDFCGNTTLNQNGQLIMDQGFTLEAESNVVVYFTFQFGFNTPRQEGLMSFGLDGANTNKEWGVAAPGSITAQSFSVRQSTTLMWSFDNVAPGVRHVKAFARVSTGFASMSGCALTVLVSPVAA